MKVTGTFYSSLYKPVGKRFTTTFEDLSARFREPRRVSALDLTTASKEQIDALKKPLPGWSPATFKDEHRSLKTFEGASCIGVDVDGGLPFDDAVAELRGVRAIIHTTFQSTAASPRLRVVVPAARVVDEVEYRAMWKGLATRLALAGHHVKVDTGACDPSRFWFLPATTRDGAYRCEVLSGAPLDVPAVGRATVVASVPAPSSRPAAPTSSSSKRPGPVERARLFLESCPPAVSGQSGQARTFYVAMCVARGFDLGEETTFELMRDHFNARCEPPWDELGLRRKVKHAAERGTMPVGQFLEVAS